MSKQIKINSEWLKGLKLKADKVKGNEISMTLDNEGIKFINRLQSLLGYIESIEYLLEDDNN